VRAKKANSGTGKRLSFWEEEIFPNGDANVEERKQALSSWETNFGGKLLVTQMKENGERRKLLRRGRVKQQQRAPLLEATVKRVGKMGSGL